VSSGAVFPCLMDRVIALYFWALSLIPNYSRFATEINAPPYLPLECDYELPTKDCQRESEEEKCPCFVNAWRSINITCREVEAVFDFKTIAVGVSKQIYPVSYRY
jgi:hypothetical protein